MTDYKLVPVEPTQEMINAATQDGICVDGKPVWKRDVVFQAKWRYQQMLAAAPDHIPNTGKNVSREQIRKVFIRNGFTIKDGRDDLADYVYAAAYDLLQAVQGEPVAEVRIENDYWNRGHFYEGSRKELKVVSSIQDLPVGTKLYTAPKPAEQQPITCVGCEGSPAPENSPCAVCGQKSTPDVEVLAKALESLIKGYVGLLEAGKDRITSLGGDCDPVPVMEQNDPWLRDARAALAAHRKQGGNHGD